MSSKNNLSSAETLRNIKETDEGTNLPSSNQNVPSSSYSQQSKENESNSSISKDSTMSFLNLDLNGPPRILSSTSNLSSSLSSSFYKLKRSYKTLNNYKPMSIGIMDQPHPEWPITPTFSKSQSKEIAKTKESPKNSMYYEISKILEDIIDKRVTPSSDSQSTSSVTWGPITQIKNSQIDPNKISDSFIKHSKQVRRLSNNLLKKEGDISEVANLSLEPHTKSSIRMVHYYDMDDVNSNQPSNDSQTPFYINKQSLEINSILINKETSESIQNVNNKSSSQFKKLSFRNSVEIQNTRYEPSSETESSNELSYDKENIKEEIQKNLKILDENKQDVNFEGLNKKRSNENLIISSLKNELQETQDHSCKNREDKLEEKLNDENKIQEDSKKEKINAFLENQTNTMQSNFSEGEIEIETSDDSDYTSIDNFENNFHKDKNISLKKLTIQQILKQRNEIECSGKRILNINFKNSLPLYTVINKNLYTKNIPEKVEKLEPITQDEIKISKNDFSEIAEKLNEYINYPIEKHSRNLDKLDENKEIIKDPAQEVKEIFSELKELLKFAKPASDAVRSFEDFEKHLKSLKKESLNFRKLNNLTTKTEGKETDETFKFSDKALKSLKSPSKEKKEDKEIKLKDFIASNFEMFANPKEGNISNQNGKELSATKENLNFTHQNLVLDAPNEENKNKQKNEEILFFEPNQSNEEFNLKKVEKSNNTKEKFTKSSENEDSHFLNCNYDTSDQNVSNSLTTLVEFTNSASFITKSPLQDIYSILDDLLFRTIFESNICCSSYNHLKQIHASPATIDLQLIISKERDKGECSQRLLNLENIRKIFNNQPKVKVKASPACLDLISHSNISQQKIIDQSRSLKFLHEYFPRDMIESNETLELFHRKETDENLGEISEDNLEKLRNKKLFYTPLIENLNKVQSKNENSTFLQDNVEKPSQENENTGINENSIHSNNEISPVIQMIEEEEKISSSQDNSENTFSLHLKENNEKDENYSLTPTNSEISPPFLVKENSVEYKEEIKNFSSTQGRSEISPSVKENLTEFNRVNKNFSSQVQSQNSSFNQVNENKEESKGKNENSPHSQGNNDISSYIKIKENLIEEIKNFSFSQLKSEISQSVKKNASEFIKENKKFSSNQVKKNKEKNENSTLSQTNNEILPCIKTKEFNFKNKKLSSSQEENSSPIQLNEDSFPLQSEIKYSSIQIKENSEKIKGKNTNFPEFLKNFGDKNKKSSSQSPKDQNENFSLDENSSIQETEYPKDIIENNNKPTSPEISEKNLSFSVTEKEKVEKSLTSKNDENSEGENKNNKQIKLNENWTDKEQKVDVDCTNENLISFKITKNTDVHTQNSNNNNNTIIVRHQSQKSTLPSLELSSELSSLLSKSVQRVVTSPENVTFKLSNIDTSNLNNTLKTSKLLLQSQKIDKKSPNKTEPNLTPNPDQPRNSRCQSASPTPKPRGGARKKTRVLKHNAKQIRSTKHRSPKPCRACNGQNTCVYASKSPVRNLKKKEENESKQKVQTSARKEENVNASHTTNKLPTTPTKKYRHSRKFRSFNSDDSVDKDTHRRLEGPVILDTQAMRELARDPHNFFFNTSRELGGLLCPPPPPPPPPTPASLPDQTSESLPPIEPSCSSNQDDEEESILTPPPPIPSTSSLFNSNDRPLAEESIFVFSKKFDDSKFEHIINEENNQSSEEEDARLTSLTTSISDTGIEELCKKSINTPTYLPDIPSSSLSKLKEKQKKNLWNRLFGVFKRPTRK